MYVTKDGDQTPPLHADLGKCCTIGVAIEATKTKVVLPGINEIRLLPRCLGK